jgi:hypothetical protein
VVVPAEKRQADLRLLLAWRDVHSRFNQCCDRQGQGPGPGPGQGPGQELEQEQNEPRGIAKERMEAASEKLEISGNDARLEMGAWV